MIGEKWKTYMRTFRAMIWFFGVACVTGFCFGQDSNNPKLVVFGGAGVTNQSAANHCSLHFGVALEEIPPVKFREFPRGFLFEGGYVGPANALESGSALFSANYAGAYNTAKAVHSLLFFTGGYTRLFGTGNGVNFGGGIDFLLNKAYATHASFRPRLRFEVRDYLRISGPKEHNVAFRVGFIKY